MGGTGGITLNMTGGGADDITTVAGSINTLNLTGTNTLASYGQDTIHGDASNTMLSIFGNSTVMLDGGNNSILLAGKDVLTVAAGHDNITLAQGSSVTLALHGNHAVHGQGGTLALSFTNSAGQISDASAAGTTEATTDVNGGIHMETRSFGTAISAGAGLFSLDSNGADQVTLGTGAAKLAIWAAGAVVHVGAGTASITGGFVDGAFTVIGGTGLISADSAGMRMTFIGGSGNAVLSGHSLDVFGGTGAISASGVHSFTGSAGSADLVLTGGAKVAFGSGNAHVAEAPWGDADTFTLSPTAVGHAVIDGFRIGTDHLAMAPGMSVASQSVGAGGAHLIFNTGTDLMLTGVQDTKGLFA